MWYYDKPDMYGKFKRLSAGLRTEIPRDRCGETPHHKIWRLDSSAAEKYVKFQND